MKGNPVFKRIFLSVAIALGALALGGCAAVSQTPQQSVFQAKTTLDTALTAAVAYKRLPVCSATVKAPCSDPAVVAQLAKAGNAADVALDAAETAVRTPGFGAGVVSTALASARAAITAFVSLTSTLGSR